MTIRVLLDSTYLLPSFGIEVYNLKGSDLKRLREAWLQKLIKFYAVEVIWIELLGKVYKEANKRKINIEEFDLAIKSLNESRFLNWIKPTTEILKLALKLRSLGHKDMIDNILYATALTNKLIFLTMDEELKDFLYTNNFDISMLKSHGELLREL